MESQRIARADNLEVLAGRNSGWLTRRLSLDWRLALTTSLIVTFVMGAATVPFHLAEMSKQRHGRESLLRQSLAPLLLQMATVATTGELQQVSLAFHEAFVHLGYPDHQLRVLDAHGNPVFSTTLESPADEGSTFQAKARFTSEILLGGEGIIEIWQNGDEYAIAEARQWNSWLFHMIATILALFIFLLVTIRIQVTSPLLQLLDGIHKTELGYWGELKIPSGAWEIRFLALRFRAMGIALRKSVADLLAAERRAANSLTVARREGAKENQLIPTLPGTGIIRTELSEEAAELFRTCQVLESSTTPSFQDLQLARQMWINGAVTAERLGYLNLKVRIEDAALKILEPDAFLETAQAVQDQSVIRQNWGAKMETRLLSILDAALVPCLLVQYRVKHIAGVWRKMQMKGLEFAQIHDMSAFRIIVPTEECCYAALGLLHELFEPIPGRFKDYIANPKPNGYQSLHTCLSSEDRSVFEIQIRTVAMHNLAEQGPAAHWHYKVSAQGEQFRQSPAMSWLNRWWAKMRLSNSVHT